MKKLVFIILMSYISTCVGQDFHLTYSWYGLGSNRDQPSDLIINISDSLLSYRVFEKGEKYSVDKRYKDTTWSKKEVIYQAPFRKSSIDSIITFLKGKEGKYIFNSNPAIMSGSIEQFYIEYRNWCTQFNLKNTFDSTALNIANAINTYLPKNHQIRIPYSRWRNRDDKPIIKNCPTNKSKTYMDILEEEYDLIRQKKN